MGVSFTLLALALSASSLVHAQAVSLDSSIFYTVALAKGKDAGCSPLKNMLSNQGCDQTTQDLWSTDDGSHNQRYRFVPVSGMANTFNIVTGCAQYLSCQDCGGKTTTDLYNIDDGSGRQRWILTPVSGAANTYTIRVAGGRDASCGVYLSTGSACEDTFVDLFTQDDGSAMGVKSNSGPDVVLPGFSNVAGLWPAVWAMGNLGRAGFGASLEGMWPYTYDACDVGTLSNQTLKGVPHLATVDGDAQYGGSLSYLPGQKLSRCTCPGESHPGPIHQDGSYVGRAAPEIDMFEAQVGSNFAKTDGLLHGEVSQSGQWAPFNYAYTWFDTPQNQIIANSSITVPNGYKGGIFQQATSCVTKTNHKCYSMEEGCFALYGFEYKPGYDEGYITWLSDGVVSWTVNGAGLAKDERVNLAARPVPQEPMYLIANLGMSKNFGDVDINHLVFPVSMLIDYIRVYQDPKNINIGCDPKDFPTAAYIKEYITAYTNANLTTWRDDFKQPFPKNRLIDQC